MPDVNVFDVAAYILNKKGAMNTFKLHKLVYYSQAWSLVWDEEPLFYDKIEAWANGPVIPKLYHEHKGRFKISKVERGRRSKLSKTQRETIDAVLEHYGDILYKLGNLDEALEYWKKAKERNEYSEFLDKKIKDKKLYE